MEKMTKSPLSDCVKFVYENQVLMKKIPPKLTYPDLMRILVLNFDIPPQHSSLLYLEWEAHGNDEKNSNMAEVSLSPSLTVQHSKSPSRLRSHRAK